MIADLEAKREAEKERAKESDETCSALKERVAEMGNVLLVLLWKK